MMSLGLQKPCYLQQEFIKTHQTIIMHTKKDDSTYWLYVEAFLTLSIHLGAIPALPEGNWPVPWSPELSSQQIFHPL